MNNSTAKHFKALYGDKLSAKRTENLWSKAAGHIHLRTSIRLLLGIILASEFTLIHFFGKFVTMQHEIFEKGSRLEVEYQRRENDLPQLLTITKAYSRHERGLMNYVSDARALEKSARKLKALLGPEKGAQIGKVVSSLIALAEQYPNLKAEQSYQALMEKTVATENRIAAAREAYNAKICSYNRTVQTFPDVMYARFLKFEPMDVYAPQKDPMPAKAGRFCFIY